MKLGKTGLFIFYRPLTKPGVGFVKGHGYLFRWMLRAWPFIVWRMP